MIESPLAVLVVDDEENHADVIAVSLEKLRMSVITANNFAEAMQAIALCIGFGYNVAA